ncbi:MAG: hypothetical protein QM668_17810 [Agriterribacter sp.]
MKKGFLLFIVYASALIPYISDAQDNKRIDPEKRPVKDKISVFVAGGSSFASGNMKDSLFIRNGWNIEAGIYIPFFYSGAHSIETKAANYFTAGIEANINYAQHEADGGMASYTNAFRLQNGTISPSFEGSTPYAGLFQVLAGPRATWTLGKASVAPSVLLGYLSLNRKGYILSDAVINPKQSEEGRNIPFITAAGYSTSGFVVKPQITIDYYLTTKFSVFAGGAISFGPPVQNSITYWKPEGKAAEDNMYSYDQFMDGETKAATFSSRWQAASVNLGLRYTWIKNAPDKERSSKKQKATAPAKPGGAVSSSYAAGKAVSPNQENNTPQGISTATDFNTTRSNRDNRILTDPDTASTGTETSSDSSMQSRLSMTPTTTRQTQGKTFGEKVAQGMAVNNPLYEGNGTGGNNPIYEPKKLAMPGSPIGGIVVKGGKNPGGNNIILQSGNNGEVLLNNLEAGNYSFQLSLPGQSTGSIAVKGGKNPGEDFTSLTVNNNGQIAFEVLEPGNYKLIIQTPEAPGTEKTKKKVVEKATSGLKDTLKTNV